MLNFKFIFKNIGTNLTTKLISRVFQYIFKGLGLSVMNLCLFLYLIRKAVTPWDHFIKKYSSKKVERFYGEKYSIS